MTNETAVFGVYHDRPAAEKALGWLKSDGFMNTDISILFPESDGLGDFTQEKDAKAPGGTTTGVASGAVIGGALGWLASIGILTIPGVGPFFAAGPIMASLAGIGAGGAMGGVVGALVGFGLPEHKARLYEGHVNKGGILLLVHCGDQIGVARAKDTLRTSGAQDIASSGEASADIKKEPVGTF